jgi:hypothetical protein
MERDETYFDVEHFLVLKKGKVQGNIPRNYMNSPRYVSF